MKAIYLRKDKAQTIPYKWHISSEIELRCVLSNNSPYTWSLIIHILVSVPFIWGSLRHIWHKSFFLI